MIDYPELDYKYPMSILKLILDFRSEFNNHFNYLIRDFPIFSDSNSAFLELKFYGDFFHFVPTCAPRSVYCRGDSL